MNQLTHPPTNKPNRHKETLIVNLYHRINSLDSMNTSYRAKKSEEKRSIAFLNELIHVPAMDKLMFVIGSLMVWKRSKVIRIQPAEDHRVLCVLRAGERDIQDDGVPEAVPGRVRGL